MKNTLVNGRLRERNGIYHAVLYWYDENNKQRTHSFSTKIRTDEKNARKRAEEILLKARVEFLPQKEKEQIARSNLYVEDYFELMLNKYIVLRHLAISSGITVKRHYKRVYSFFHGKKITLKELNKTHVEDFLFYLLSTRKLNPSTANNNYAFFKAICNMAIEEELISFKIFNGIKYTFKKKKKEYATLEKNFIREFLECLRKEKYMLELLLFLFYGCRTGETLGVTFSVVNFTENTIKIKKSLVWNTEKKEYYVNEFLKTDSSRRTLPLFEEMKSLFLERKERIEKNKKFFKNSYDNTWEDYICVKEDGKMIAYHTLRYFLEVFCKKYNFPRLTPHLLRHTFATIMHSEGMDLKDLQMWLGHSSIKMTADTYVHSDITKNSVAVSNVRKTMITKNI
ncbi:Recombinase [Fusobacterium necrophorum subsp. funduliforme]|uniref:tyrosine-type recombinase/integrase n=1 Tax=Fusobacterium necrophorum TaxID=859 RepID=UPI00370F216C